MSYNIYTYFIPQCLFRCLFGQFPVFLPFFMLSCVISCDFLPSGFSNSCPVKVLDNHRLRLVQSRMKYIGVIPLHCLFLDLLWDDYFIFVSYKFYSIPASMKIHFLIFFAVKFFYYDGVFRMIVDYYVKLSWKCDISNFFGIVQFQHSFHIIR